VDDGLTSVGSRRRRMRTENGCRRICAGMSILPACTRRVGETRLNAVLLNPMETEMTVTALFDDGDFNSRRPATNPVATAFAAAARAVANWRADRARVVALDDLLAMEPHRLRDLGISVHDIHDALVRR
jgi:uncharacterized protein YjiS (DUF1127 family)